MNLNRRLSVNVSMLFLLGLTVISAAIFFIADEAKDVIGASPAELIGDAII